MNPPTIDPAVDAFAQYRAVRVFDSLDGIRALSILAVIWHHACNGVEFLPILKLGYLGVDMFFVLSGFLIVTLLLRESERTGTISLRKFYVRRTLRIFPLYYTFLLVTTLAFATLLRNRPEAMYYWPSLPYWLTYTSNWVPITAVGMMGLMAPLWSLATEEQFYLVWPAIQKYSRTGVRVGVALAGIALCQLSNFRFLDGWYVENFGVRYNDLNILQATFTPILLGVVLAHALHDRRWFARLHPMLGLPGIGLLLVGLLVAMGSIDRPDLNGYSDIGGVQRLAIQAMMALMLASCVVREDHSLRKVLAWRPLARIGEVSYGMYMLHLLVLVVVWGVLKRAGVTMDPPDRFPGWLIRYALTVAATWFAAELSFRLLEARFLRLRSRFRA